MELKSSPLPQCYKSSKDHAPQMELTLCGCSVTHVPKDGKKKKHELKIVHQGADPLVLAVQSQEQAEEWLKVTTATLGPPSSLLRLTASCVSARALWRPPRRGGGTPVLTGWPELLPTTNLLPVARRPHLQDAGTGLEFRHVR